MLKKVLNNNVGYYVIMLFFQHVFFDTFVPISIFNITTCYPCDFVILSSRRNLEHEMLNTWETEHKCVENCSSVSSSPDLWRAERCRCVLISHSLHVWYEVSCYLCLHPIFLGWVEMLHLLSQCHILETNGNHLWNHGR
jgi:hypothetical protein